MLRGVVLSGAKNLYDCPRDPSLRSGNHDWIHNITYQSKEKKRMKSKKLSVLLAVIALLLSTLACALVAGEPSLTNPRMTTDSDGVNTTTVYSSTDAFYAVADLSNVETGSMVDAKWYLVSAADYDPGEIQSTSLTIDDKNLYSYVSFELTSETGWPVGEYKAELYLNGTLAHTINFSVQ
jgi:hypothetical protein